MTAKDVNSIGLVGARAYEMQAWNSPGANALEEAYWGPQSSKSRPPIKSRLMQFIDGISAAAVIVASPK